MRHPAYTLIETMIVATIIALLGVAAWPSLNSYRNTMEFEQAAQTLQDCLIMPQKLARAPIASSNAAAPYPVAYQATLLGTVSKNCSVSLSGSTDTIEKYPFDDSYIFSINAGDSWVETKVFTSPPYKSELLSSSGGTGVVTVIMNKGTMSKTFKLDSVTGQVEIQP